MPITAKLSQLFYDRLGDQVANELVEWFNIVDDSYRADLRELNESNFARFDAKMELRLAQVDRGFDKVDQRMDRRFEQVDKRFEELLISIDHQFEVFEARIEVRLARFEAKMMRWMLIFWSGQTVALTSLVYVMLHNR